MPRQNFDEGAENFVLIVWPKSKVNARPNEPKDFIVMFWDL